MPGSLWQMLRSDVYRYRASADWHAFLSAYLEDPGFRFTWYLRKVTFYSANKASWRFPAYLYNRLLLNHHRLKYGFDISPTTKIGPGLYLGHFGGVVISPYAILGENINIAHGVTIGAESRGRRRGAPTLENRVWVGPHAIIVGKITVGAEAMIGPGAYVNFDVPAKALVLGNPGKVVSFPGSAGYVNNTMVPAEGTPSALDRPLEEEFESRAGRTSKGIVL
jgi:serine O-acetyltransferase